VIGEIAKRITQETRLQHPALPWSDMARMRDMLIHSYGKVDVDNVWDTVQRDLPPLIRYLEKILPPEDSS
jgi:uncharacterized protein with HEPN domain